MMSRFFLFIKFVFVMGILLLSAFYKGEVSLSWLDRTFHLDLFFVILCVFVVIFGITRFFKLLGWGRFVLKKRRIEKNHHIFDQGVGLFFQKHYQESLLHFKNLKDPLASRSSLDYMKALCHLKQSNSFSFETVSAFEACFKSPEFLEPSLVSLGIMCAKSSHFPQAATYFERLFGLKRIPSQKLINMYRFVRLNLLGDFLLKETETSLHRSLSTQDKKMQKAYELVRIFEHTQDINFIKKAFSLAPVPFIGMIYVKELCKSSRDQALSVLESCFDVKIHRTLVDLYFSISTELTPLKKYEKVISLTKEHLHEYEALYLSLKFSVQAQLWGEANRFLDLIRIQQKDCFPREILELKWGLEVPSQKVLLQDLNRMKSNPSWICCSCGASYDIYKIACATCYHVDTIQWSFKEVDAL